MHTPILFLVFNRPLTTERVFSTIRAARPQKLFIAADGPRAHVPEDTERCRQVREVVARVDWPCEVKTLFRNTNLGCKVAVSSAINWFFSQVEEGVILEDDCLPSPSFFPYCEELLAKYRTDERIMMVSGFNAAGSWKTSASYFFSKYTAIWGWATWRRAWQHYDVSMKSWAEPANKERVRTAIGDPAIWKIKQWTYDNLAADRKNTWDYQWEYAILLKGGLDVIPRENLIENIGFGSAATHTPTSEHHRLPAARSLSTPLAHPTTMTSDQAYDAFFARRWKQSGSLISRLFARIKKCL